MNKRLAVGLVGLVLLVVIIVLNVFVFTVQKIEVDFDVESEIAIDDNLNEKVISSSGIKKGKNIFAVSESKIVNNIEANYPDVNVINIERVFPNKMIIHVSQRVPVYIIAYKGSSQMSAQNYVLADADMVVNKFTDKVDGDYIKVSGFSLIGNHYCNIGKTISVEFGDEVYYLQNIASNFYKLGFTPKAYMSFVDTISFVSDVINIVTKSGVTIRLGNKLTTRDIAERIPKAYEWYKTELKKGDDNPALKTGILIYQNGTFVHNNY